MRLAYGRELPPFHWLVAGCARQRAGQTAGLLRPFQLFLWQQLRWADLQPASVRCLGSTHVRPSCYIVRGVGWVS